MGCRGYKIYIAERYGGPTRDEEAIRGKVLSIKTEGGRERDD